MLQATLIVMTVLGCGDQAKSCDHIPGPKAVWQNKAACEAAISDVLRKSRNAPYPIITAECTSKTKAVKTKRPTIEPVEIAQEPKQPEGKVKTGAPSIVGTAVTRTKDGLLSVRDGAVEAAGDLRDGASYAYSGIAGGVRTSIDGTKSVAKRTIGAVRGRLGL